LNRYRRVEVRAFHDRTIIASGELPGALFNEEIHATADGVRLNDAMLSEPIEPDSLEGQRILVEALRSIERRLTSETRARLHANEPNLVPKD
jgi:hypothetical protein